MSTRFLPTTAEVCRVKILLLSYLGNYEGLSGGWRGRSEGHFTGLESVATVTREITTTFRKIRSKNY